MNKEIKFLAVDVGYNNENYLLVSTYVKNKFLRIDKKIILSNECKDADIAEKVIEVFNQYDCDYVVADCMGSEVLMVTNLIKEFDVDKIIMSKYFAQNISDALCSIRNDVQSNRLLFNYENKEFAEVYKNNSEIIYFDNIGRCKISINIDKNLRKTLQILVKIYDGIHKYERNEIGLTDDKMRKVFGMVEDVPSKMFSFFKSGTELSELSLKVAKNFGNLHINTERGEGSTYACLIGATVDAMKVGYTNVGIITPYQTMYKIMFRHITDIIESDDIFKKNIYKITNDAIFFKNGSKIEFISPYNSPRHHRLDVVYVDMYDKMDKDKVYFIINGCQNPKVVIFENVSEEIFNLKFTKIE